MAEKYKIKYPSGRIVGPFTVSQVGELYIRGKIEGDEEFQHFPDGKWQHVEYCDEILDLINGIINDEHSMENLENKKSNKTIEKIYMGEGLAEEKSGADKSTETDEVEFREFEFKKEDEHVPESVVLEETGEEPVSDDSDIEKTVLVRDIHKPTTQYDKTKVIEQQVPYAEEKLEEVPDEDLGKEEEAHKEKVVDRAAGTKVVNLEEILPEIKKETEKAEEEFEKQLTILEKSEKTFVKIKSFTKKIPPKKRNRILYAVTLFMIAWYVFFPSEDTDDAIKLIYPQIQFPVVNEYINKEVAKEFYIKGINEYRKGTYKSKLKSAEYFLTSSRAQFRKNDALSWLILTYAEMLPNVKDKSWANGILFRLVEINKINLLKNANAAYGAALFYFQNQKYKTAIKIMEDYLRMEQKPNIKLMSLLLGAFIKEGRLADAKKIFTKLLSVKNSIPEKEIYCSMFHEINQEFDKGKKLLEIAGAKHPKSVQLILEYNKYILREKNYSKFEKNLEVLKRLRLESSPVYYAKYLEYRGFLSAWQRKPKLAAKYFKKALSISESDQLRSRLAELEAGGDKVSKHIILESEIIDLMRTSQRFAKKKKWEEAYKYAIEASDKHKDYIPSQMWLVDLQLKRGHYFWAIKKLEELQAKHKNNINIRLKLVEAYIDSGRVTKAQKMLSLISQYEKIVFSAKYSSLVGRVFLKKEKLVVAMRNLREGLERDPMNTEDYFELAKIYLKYRKYKKSIAMLKRAMTLEPDNTEYISLYADILYDKDGANVAIGFLRNELKKYPDEPVLLGKIAIFYHDSGQVKFYEKYKNKLEKLRTEDTSLYKFLIKKATMEGNFNEAIKSSEKISILDPGDLKNKVILGENLMKVKRYNDAKAVFEDVFENMPSHKDINYFIGKLHYLQNSFDEAITRGASETEFYPNSEKGYMILGKSFLKKAIQSKNKKEKSNNYSKAIKNLSTAISKNPKSIEALMNLGSIEFRQGRYDAAREYYNRAWEQEKTNPEVNKQLGYVYKVIGQGNLALEFFKNYLNLYPNAPDRNKIKTEIRRLR